MGFSTDDPFSVPENPGRMEASEERRKQIMDTTLGKRIGTLRREKNLTQEDLARRLSVSPQAVSKWENDQTCPDISLLPALAEILETSVDALLTGKDQAPVKLVSVEEKPDTGNMVFRIQVDSVQGDKVRVNLPVRLVELAVEIGMELPQISGSDALKGLDLGKMLELVRCGVMGNLVEVESGDGDTVRIFVESL